MENLRKNMYLVVDSIIELLEKKLEGGVNLAKSEGAKIIQSVENKVEEVVEPVLSKRKEAMKKVVKEVEKAPEVKEAVVEEKKVDFDNLRAECTRLALTHIKKAGRTRVVEILQSFGVSSVPTVKPEDLVKFKKELEAL